MTSIACPAGCVVLSVDGREVVECAIAIRIQEDAVRFPVESCLDYTNCSLWRNAKDKGDA